MNCDTAFDPSTRGEAYGLGFADAVGGVYTDFATTRAYLFLVSSGGTRFRYKWEPGEAGNHGQAASVDGHSAVLFLFSAEYTRSADYPPTDVYDAYLHVGPLTGTANFGKKVGTLTVQLLADGKDVS